MSYTPIWVKSHYSFLEGSSSAEELVDRADELELPAIAITDRNGLYGIPKAYIRTKETHTKLIIGAEIHLPDFENKRSPLLLYAQNRQGYGNLCRLLTRGQHLAEKGDALFSFELLAAHHQSLLAVVTSSAHLAQIQDIFRDRSYALLTRHLESKDTKKNDEMKQDASRMSIPLIANTEVLYHDVKRRDLQDVMTCIRHNTSLQHGSKYLKSNAMHSLLSPERMQKLFHDEPDALERSNEIAKRCAFSLSDLRYRYPAEKLPEGESERSWLRKRSYQGAQTRYPQSEYPDGIPKEVVAQLERELAIIQQLEYDGYFLTMQDIVRFCGDNDIYCQGRGSAANSIICYCLGITAIDPVHMDLLFERFLSVERAEPPDIDLDIEHERREEVIQYLYARHGRRHAAMVANVIRYRSRSAMRDVGKALGIPATQIDGACKQIRHYSEGIDAEILKQAGFPKGKITQHFVKLCAEILNAPRHLSVHPGGFLLGDAPVDELVPVEPATMENRTVIQWDKYDVEALNLFKVDLLGLGALTCIHRAFDLIREHHHRDLNLATVPQEDPATYQMVSRGDTVGVFQIESRAQMAMLPRMQPRTFYDLVIEVAIVRPGPIQGDMVHPYLRRREGKEKEEYPHPALRRVLKKTLGVPIFQEQVMKIAVLVGGYSPGEADQLRRDMAAWKQSGRIERHHDQLVSRMVENGISQAFAERIFSQIRGFGEYGFPESHAASFAHLTYITSWLKCHYPEAFACALLNSQPMGFYSPATILGDLKRHDGTILPIDIQRSRWDCQLEPLQLHSPPIKHVSQKSNTHPYGLRMGMRFIKGMQRDEYDKLVREVERTPRPFVDIDDVATRTQMNDSALSGLAESGAFDSLGINRRDALWQLKRAVRTYQDTLKIDSSTSQLSFDSLSTHEAVEWDYRSSLHSTRGHPMQRIRPQLNRQRIPSAKRLRTFRHRSFVTYIGVVICRQRPATASGVTFFTLEDESGFVNLVVWKDTFEKYRTIAKSATLLGVQGTLEKSSGVCHLIADKLWIPKHEIGGAPSSRDFH